LKRRTEDGFSLKTPRPPENGYVYRFRWNES
jgi:hypothetical protein